MNPNTRRTGRMTVFTSVLLTVLSSCLASDEIFAERTVQVGAESYTYRVFVPANWTVERQWPVVLFLHGAGERGADGLQQTRVGLGPVLQRSRDFPAVVVMPQCRRGAWWGDEEMEAMVMQAWQASMKEFNGDPNRVYLTGLSLGGFAVWAFGYKYPDRFAALVPVCGGVVSRFSRRQPPSWHPAADPAADPYDKTAQGIGDTPVWAFHGAADPVVPATESRRLTAALKDAGGSVKYTEYPGVGHNSWDRAYSDPELIPWLFSQKRKQE